ncbi:MAG: site-specific DNA-methyltransferase [Chloroflexi bacterium]|nr:site-specific DNA-methyltransferase [Chloroflexota bacterium]
MRSLPPASIDLIYSDPPFFSRRRQRGATADHSFADTWAGGLDGYLEWLTPRLAEMKRLLRPSGTIWLHLDWHAAHYVKVAADRLFGYRRFRNEIVWAYGAGARGAKAVGGHLPRNHDVLLVYASGPRPKYRPLYAEKITPLAHVARNGYRLDADGRVFKTAPRGDYTDESITRLEAEDRIYRTRSGAVRVKYFLERRGDQVVERRILGDVWTDVPDLMHARGRERLGYPTQKPEALLERIMACASDPGDLVADFFCGAGTTAAVAQRLGRRWLACDESPAAVTITRDRLARVSEQLCLNGSGFAVPDFTVERFA